MSRDHPITLRHIKDAQETIANMVHNTPVLKSRSFTQLCETPIFLKAENLQRTGSFKIRGAANCVARISKVREHPKVIAASAGNHAQGVALASQIAGIPCTVVMAKGASTAKVVATRSYHAEVVLHGRNYEEAQAEASRRAKEDNLVIIPAFDDADVIAGQGTIGLEILKDLPDVESVVVPVGGGGLIGGLALAIKELRPGAKVYGVQAESCPGAKELFHTGKATSGTRSTIADGIAVERPSELTRNLMRQYVDDIVTVTEDEIAHTMLLLLERTKMVVEGAGAVGLAALMNKRINTEGRRTLVLLSGGNLDVSVLARIGDHGLAYAGRYRVLRVVLPDRPGQLARLTSIIAESEANVVEVDHHRHGIDLSMNQIEIGITVETRDEGHVNQVARLLEENGYLVQAAPTQSSSVGTLRFVQQDVEGVDA